MTEQGGIVAINSSETLAMGVTDAYSQLRALLNTDDVLTLAWQESAAILARLDRSETVSVGVTDAGQIAVAVNSGGDVLTLGLTDASRTLVSVAGADAVAAILSESASIFASLTTDDPISCKFQM